MKTKEALGVLMAGAGYALAAGAQVAQETAERAMRVAHVRERLSRWCMYHAQQFLGVDPAERFGVFFLADDVDECDETPGANEVH